MLGPELGGYVEIGASPRGTIAFFQVARALAVLNGRNYVDPRGRPASCGTACSGTGST